MVQEDGELGPLTECVVHRLAEQTLRQDLRGECLEPGVELRDDGRGALGAHPQAFLRARGMLPIPQGTLDQVELADELQCAAGVTVGSLLARLARLVELSPRVSHASGVHQAQRLGDALVRLIAVSQQDTVITLQ
jgi:hypothetical protein